MLPNSILLPLLVFFGVASAAPQIRDAAACPLKNVTLTTAGYQLPPTQLTSDQGCTYGVRLSRILTLSTSSPCLLDTMPMSSFAWIPLQMLATSIFTMESETAECKWRFFLSVELWWVFFNFREPLFFLIFRFSMKDCEGCPKTQEFTANWPTDFYIYTQTWDSKSFILQLNIQLRPGECLQLHK